MIKSMTKIRMKMTLDGGTATGSMRRVQSKITTRIRMRLPGRDML